MLTNNIDKLEVGTGQYTFLLNERGGIIDDLIVYRTAPETFLLVVNALRLLSAAVAGIAATTEPVFAAGLAWVFLGQSLAPAQLIGGGLVVGGVVLAQLVRH